MFHIIRRFLLIHGLILALAIHALPLVPRGRPGSPSPSSNQAGSSIHPASLVDISNHNPALLDLTHLSPDMSLPLRQYFLDYAAEHVEAVLKQYYIGYMTGQQKLIVPPQFTASAMASLHWAQVKPGVILVALVYIDRVAKAHSGRSSLLIPNDAAGTNSLLRLFVGSLIAASKYTNDSTYKNIRWSQITGLPLNTISTVENQFLNLIKHELGFTEEDLLKYRAPICQRLVATFSSRAPSSCHKP